MNRKRLRRKLQRLDREILLLFIYFYQSNSSCLWKTVKEAQEECPQVKSCRLDVVKYHIHTLYIGLELEDARHAYSKDGPTYTADEIFEHLVETAIPQYINLKRKDKLPTVALLKLPCPPNVATLGLHDALPILVHNRWGYERGGIRLTGIRAGGIDRKSTRLNSSHSERSRMPSSA